jgi:hypothetical protein
LTPWDPQRERDLGWDKVHIYHAHPPWTVLLSLLGVWFSSTWHYDMITWTLYYFGEDSWGGKKKMLAGIAFFMIALWCYLGRRWNITQSQELFCMAQVNAKIHKDLPTC